jgi:hypothetical protein
MSLGRNGGLPLQRIPLRPDHFISGPVRSKGAFRRAISYKNGIRFWGCWLSVV